VPQGSHGVPRIEHWIVIDPAGGDLLAAWQEASAAAWGHASATARHAADTFAAAAAIVDGDGLVLARHRSDGRSLACASMTVVDGVATLGGMSTLPAERGQGLQSALIRHRLRRARVLGCAFATSQAEPGGASERNLLRHGFERWGEIVEWPRAPDPAAR
jgi:GNAT superfamily N-acetyltransferase